MAEFMELVKHFCLQRVALYILIVITSFLVIVPLGELQSNFGNNCLLYGGMNYNNSPTHHYFQVVFGPDSVCQYRLAVAGAFSLIYAALAIGLYVFLFVRERQDNKVDLAHVLFQVHCGLEVGLCMLVLVAACMVSHGFSVFCQSVMAGRQHGIPLTGCENIIQFEHWSEHDPSNFHICLTVAVVGSWLEFLFWLLQSAFGVWKLWRMNMIPPIPDKLKICCKDS